MSNNILVGLAVGAAFLFSHKFAELHTEIEEGSIDKDNSYFCSSDNEKVGIARYAGMDGMAGEAERTVYEQFIKPMLDRILSFTGVIILFPIFVFIALAIMIDDPGPVFFKQKRIGVNCHYFYLHKFRTMKTCTPYDVPTHELINPEQYITRVGRVLRRTSLDELPQMYDIFRGKMSVIGPRPALWNQDDLVSLRSGSGLNDIDANSVTPGLTGYAQIKGRDELELNVKAGYDRKYVSVLRDSSMSGFMMDVRCFFGTLVAVLRHDGVVEGGTGALSKASNSHSNE